MTKDDVENLHLGISQVTDKTVILVESAFSWIKKNTKIEIDLENPSADVKLFIDKYIDVMNKRAGVTSESIQGMSQSFDVGNLNSMLLEYARSLFGDDMMVSDLQVVSCSRRYVYL